MATELFQNMFVSMAEYISQEGSDSAKSKLATLKRIQSKTQEITQELLATAKNYNDIPVATRKKLLSVVYDSMTSDMPPLAQWGEGIGQDLGIPQERLNELKGASK